MQYIPMTTKEKERIQMILENNNSSNSNKLDELDEEQVFRDMTHYEVISNFNRLKEEDQKEVLRKLIQDYKGNKVELLRKLSNTIHL